MDKNIYSKFNEQQYKAITSNDDSLLIVAGAGSGKTSVLTYRVVYLVTEMGLDPKKILGFTFTNKAANEMKSRISSVITNVNFPYIGTFHGICLRILREDINKLNLHTINANFNIIDNEDQLVIIKDLYTKHKFDKTLLSHKNCLNYVSLLKNDNVSFDNLDFELEDIIHADFNGYKKQIVAKVYKDYVTYLTSNNLLDFDDLIKHTLKILRSNNDVLTKWQNRFEYILVDEFQDTNSEQFEIIKYLSKEKRNVFAVGDPDQMIYSWRGAYDDIFKEYIETFKNVKTIVLEKNYRSTKKILTTANKLIKNNLNRIEKNLFTDSTFEGELVFYNAPNQDMESKYVATMIKKLISQGYKYKDIAILYRSNYLSRNIEQQLTFSSIPYHIYGGFKFYQRKEIKDILSYLKLLENNDDISLTRIYNVPKRGISEAAFAKAKEYALANGITTLEAFCEADNIDGISSKGKEAMLKFYHLIQTFRTKQFPNLLNMVDFVIKEIEYNEMLIETEEEYRIDNIEEFKNAISEFENEKENATLSQYLQEVSLLTSLDDENGKQKDFVSLMTVHVAKGLEFKNIFIIEFNEGIFPSQKSIDTNDINEERRIAYVAITRAKENLYILSSDGTTFTDSFKTSKTPSRFIQELNSDYLKIVENSYKPIAQNNVQTFFSSNNINDKVDFKNHCHNYDVKFEVGDWIVHTSFGEGVVLDVDKTTVKIAFKNKGHGVKTILKNHKSLVRKLN